jgi:hypothetical protein
MATLYQCSDCGRITNTVWQRVGKQVCRVCFGRSRGEDVSYYGKAEDDIRIVKADGSVTNMTAEGITKTKATKAEIEDFGDAATRKIRIPGK